MVFSGTVEGTNISSREPVVQACGGHVNPPPPEEDPAVESKPQTCRSCQSPHPIVSELFKTRQTNTLPPPGSGLMMLRPPLRLSAHTLII